MKKVLSIVVPLFKGEPFLDNLVLHLEEFATSIKSDFKTEVIFVDDDSPDQVFELLKKIKPLNFNFKAIKLSRNFKSYLAILAGIQESSGDYITFLPQDLQESTEVTARLLDKVMKGYGVVWAVRSSRYDPFIDKILAQTFHRLMHWLWSNWPETGADVFMITREVADILLVMQEKNSHITGQILWLGFKQTRVYYIRQARKIGKSGWNTFNKIKLALDIIVQFSYLPIRLCSLLGITIASLGFVYGVFILINKLYFKIPVEGWAALMLAILIIGGVQLIFLGIIGEYLWRTFDEVRKRPSFIVMEKFSR